MSNTPTAIVKTAHIVNGNLWEIFPLINVDKTADIPCDYLGPMGVPITFIDKYNPEQFEILGITDGHFKLENGRTPYRRIIIRNLYPELPEEIDLAAYCRRIGIEAEFLFVEPGEIPDDAVPAYKSMR